MNFLARILRFVFWVVIFSWIVRLAARLVGRAMATTGEGERESGAEAADHRGASGSAEFATPAGRQLVRDPVCGMHLAETLAIPFRDRGELRHFCSAECRDKYAQEGLRRAANG
jgi:YHS domain-containing protein